jgi:hypothetical protein
MIKKSSKLCIRCNNGNLKGNKNPNWKGGHSYNKKGYRMRACPEHPRAHPTYVLEHILVMEDKLGRYLLPNERVHHKNGIRDDNRPDNLELWTTSQPSGKRVKDLVAWAKDILETYGGETGFD